MLRKKYYLFCQDNKIETIEKKRLQMHIDKNQIFSNYCLRYYIAWKTICAILKHF